MASASGPPAVRTCLCFGQYAVPFNDVLLTDDVGNFVNVHLVDISRGTGYDVYKWLWKPLGVSVADWREGKPYRLPLLQEIHAGIAGKRHKRKRDGKFYDVAGRVNSQSLVLHIRGRDLQVLNDPRKLLLNLESEDMMSWFVGELWKDLNPQPLEDSATAAPAETGALVGESSPVAPGDEVQEDDAPPVAEESAASEKKDFEEHVDAAVKATLEALRQQEHIRAVAWDKTHGRFKITVRGAALARYVPVKKYKELVKRMSRECFADALELAVADAKALL